MGEYIQADIPLNPVIETRQLQEHSAHSKSASEEMDIQAGQSQEHSTHSKSASMEMNDEEEIEEEATREIRGQIRVTSLEKPNQEDENTEGVFQAENMEISQGEGTIPEEQRPSPNKEKLFLRRKRMRSKGCERNNKGY